MSSYFSNLNMWVYEQVCSKEKPTKISDISVSIKWHYTVKFLKPFLFGKSIVTNETEH